jgi:hypothetical protein
MDVGMNIHPAYIYNGYITSLVLPDVSIAIVYIPWLQLPSLKTLKVRYARVYFPVREIPRMERSRVDASRNGKAPLRHDQSFQMPAALP